MAPQALLSNASDAVDNSSKELLHEDLQRELAKILKACTHHVSYALPKPELTGKDQGTEDVNVLASVAIADELIAVATSQIEALKWDLVGDLLNPGGIVSQAFKKACYLRYETLSNSGAPSLLGLAQLIEQKENLKKGVSRVRGDNDVELKLPFLGKKRKSFAFQGRDTHAGTTEPGLFLSSSPTPHALADESLLKKVNEMTTEEMTAELKQRGLRSSGNKADLSSRLKVARFEAYHPEEAAWANGLNGADLEKVTKQSAFDTTKGETREKLKGRLYDNPGLKPELMAELEINVEETKKVNKLIRPINVKPRDKKFYADAAERPPIVTTAEEPRRSRRLILLNYPIHTTEDDIKALLAKYGALLPIMQDKGEFLFDCDTAAGAQQAISEYDMQIVENRVTRCRLEENWIQEKKAEALKEGAAKRKKEPEANTSVKKMKYE